MYFKKFLFILIFSFLYGLFISYQNRIKGKIIIYPKTFKNNLKMNIYLDDKQKLYYYKYINYN